MTLSETAHSPWSPRQVASEALLGSFRAWSGSASCCHGLAEGKASLARSASFDVCPHAVKEQGLTPIGKRWVFTNKGDTEHPSVRARVVAQETKRKTSMDLTDTSMTVAATPPVEGFRILLSRAMTGEKRNPQDELVTAFFDISRAHFHSPVR